jgi:DNA-binding transcriptional LysR family regulator
MDLKRIQFFIAVAEELNFSRAARRLGIGQPVLSRGIKELENRLGFPLFQRSPTAVRLTPAGMAFLPNARNALRLLEEASHAGRQSANHETGDFVVGFLSSCLTSFLSDAVETFTENHPGTQISLQELDPGSQIELLRSERIDVGLLGYACAELAREFDCFDIYEVPLCVVLCARHPLAQASTVAIKDLTGFDLIGLQNEAFPGRNDLILEACRQAGLSPKLRSEARTLMDLLAAVATSDAFTLAPAEVQTIAPRQVKFLLTNPDIGSVRFAGLVRRDEARPALRAFLEQCRLRAQETASKGRIQPF